jgi:hypothetical protein
MCLIGFSVWLLSHTKTSCLDLLTFPTMLLWKQSNMTFRVTDWPASTLFELPKCLLEEFLPVVPLSNVHTPSNGDQRVKRGPGSCQRMDGGCVGVRFPPPPSPLSGDTFLTYCSSSPNIHIIHQMFLSLFQMTGPTLRATRTLEGPTMPPGDAVLQVQWGYTLLWLSVIPLFLLCGTMSNIFSLTLSKM